MLCRALIGTLARHGAVVVGGRIEFEGLDLARASERQWRSVRGRRVGYVPQSSPARLKPGLTVATQLRGADAAARGRSGAATRAQALRLPGTGGIPRAP